MAQKPLLKRAADDDRVALYPDLPFEDALAALLAVDLREAELETDGADDGGS